MREGTFPMFRVPADTPTTTHDPQTQAWDMRDPAVDVDWVPGSQTSPGCKQGSRAIQGYLSPELHMRYLGMTRAMSNTTYSYLSLRSGGWGSPICPDKPPSWESWDTHLMKRAEPRGAGGRPAWPGWMVGLGSLGWHPAGIHTVLHTCIVVIWAVIDMMMDMPLSRMSRRQNTRRPSRATLMSCSRLETRFATTIRGDSRGENTPTYLEPVSALSPGTRCATSENTMDVLPFERELGASGLDLTVSKSMSGQHNIQHSQDSRVMLVQPHAAQRLGCSWV